MPGTVSAIQTFNDFLGFNPHLHILATDACFYGNGVFRVGTELRRVRRIQPGDDEAMENLARYVIHASFSRERMTYIPEELRVVYQSNDGKQGKAFDTLEWLAAMPAWVKLSEHWCSHVPNKGESRLGGGSLLWL